MLAVIVLFPIYITVVNSLLTPAADHGAAARRSSRPTRSGTRTPTRGTPGTWATYLQEQLHRQTGLIIVGQVVTAILAGYAFAFLEFPFKRTLFVVFLATLMVPFEVTIVTNLTTISDLGWYDTYAGLAVPFLATGFGAFLMRQTFLPLPQDLRDAAALDGYGHFRFLTRVAVPLARPTIAALAVFSFLAAWNQYLWPLLVTKDDRLRTVQIGLKQLRATSIDQVNVTFAGTVIAVVPLVILLLVFQKQLVRGLTAGAVKG